jgi:hypothetical protein
MTAETTAAPWSEGDSVILTAVSYLHTGGENYQDQGLTEMPGTIVRVWSNGRNITIRTADGKTYVRAACSPSVVLAGA